MKRRLPLLMAASVVLMGCGDDGDHAVSSDSSAIGGEALDATTAETTAFHAIPTDSVVVTGTATCAVSQEVRRGATKTTWPSCSLDMSDPRVSGTGTHKRFRYFEEEGGWMWVVEEAFITNSEGTWRGTAQAVDDGTPIGEARYVGEGAYDGLVFHYYFSAPGIDVATVQGWISTSGE